MWRFLLNDNEAMGIIDEYSPVMTNVIKISFSFIFGFILKNMIRSIISHAYYQVSITNKEEVSFEEKLKERHWIVRLQEMKDPFLRYVMSFIEKKTKKTKNEKAKSIGKVVQKLASAAIKKDNEKITTMGQEK